MRVLVTGSGGLLGSNVVMEAVDAGHSVVGTYHMTEPELPAPCRRLDVRDHDAFRTLVEEFEPDVVVNCAAMTNVDECESRPGRADEVNGRAPGRLAAVCNEGEIEFVHISTDYVFDGESELKYAEDAEPNPVQAYGRSKLLGERRVRKTHSSPLVVRLSFVYGVNRATGALEGFPTWVLSQLGSGEAVPLFVDQHVTPSRAGQTAETVFELIADQANGTYHVACRDCVSPYGFGETICEQVGADGSLLTSSTMDDISRAASRPAHTCFSVERVEEQLGRVQPDLAADLRAIEDALKAGSR